MGGSHRPQTRLFNDKKIGSLIRMQRVKLGVSQTKLGDALGVTFQQIGKYEHGAQSRRPAFPICAGPSI